MGKLKNSRHERFAQLIFNGNDKGDSYLKAGYAAKTKEIASAAANRLLKNVNIEKRIAELMSKIENKAIMTAEQLLKYISDTITLNVPEVLDGGDEMIKKHGDKVDRIEFDDEGRIKKIWFVSKAKNEELLAKYHKLLTDKVEVIDKTPLHEKLAKKLFDSDLGIDEFMKVGEGGS